MAQLLFTYNFESVAWIHMTLRTVLWKSFLKWRLYFQMNLGQIRKVTNVLKEEKIVSEKTIQYILKR